MAGEIVRRPDLEAAECSYPEHQCGKIFPFWGKPAIAGRAYYQRFHSDLQVQAGRAHGSLAEITNNIVTASDTTYSCDELRSRVSMGYAQRMGFYDNEHADLYMGRLAKRSWFNKLEQMTAAKIFNTTGATDGTADPVAAIDTAVGVLRDMAYGRIGLVGANKNLVALKNNATIADRMKGTGLAGIYGLEDIRGIGWAQLGAACGVDEVLPMADHLAYAGVQGASKDCVAVVVLPDEYIDPSERVMLGNIIYFMFTDSTDDRFVMESFVNPLNDSNVVDAKGLNTLIEWNPELRKTIRIFNNNDDSSSSN